MEKGKIKIYLQYPWKFPDSPYYKYLIDFPPENAEYLNAEKQKGVITNQKFFWISNFLKRSIRQFFNISKLTIPNSHLSPEGNYDLIHCAHSLSKNLDKPWVADFESVWQFYIGKKTNRAKRKVAEILKRENCKNILAWTEETKKEILEDFPEVKNKIEVIYPAVPAQKKNIEKDEKNITLLFIARYFEAKGGLEVLDVFDKITKRHKNVEAIIVSEIPKEIKDKYFGNKEIKFLGLMSQKELFEKAYGKADIFIYPGFSDTFGFAILEAMSFGIPIVTVNGHSRKEIVNEKCGFVAERPEIEWKQDLPEIKNRENLIREIISNAEKLIENKNLRKEMSKNCIEIIKNGKFSIKERNKRLGKIYEEAIK